MSTIRVRSTRVALCTVLAALSLAVPAAATTAPSPECAGAHWVSAWAAVPSDGLVAVDPSLAPLVTGPRQSHRVITTPHVAGSQVRVRLTNRFGLAPTTFTRVTAAVAAAGPAIRPETLRHVRFSGSDSVTVPAGKEVLSDPVELDVQAFDRIAVSVYVAGATISATEHWVANERNYATLPLAGDHAAQIDGSAYSQMTTSALWVSGLDVMAPANAGSVVAFGDSITDGFGAGNSAYLPQSPLGLGTDQRYPDFLQRRLDAAGIPLVTVNAGISGNRLLRNGVAPMFGPSGLSRLQADVIDRAGVTTAIVLIGINDIGLPPYPTSQQLQDGYRTVIGRLHDAGIKVLLGTLMPVQGSILNGYSNPNSSALRSEINAWIRTQTLADGVIDFDVALRDPADPDQLNPAYNTTGDKLHPDPAGYAAMADAVDLTQMGLVSCAKPDPDRA